MDVQIIIALITAAGLSCAGTVAGLWGIIAKRTRGPEDRRADITAAFAVLEKQVEASERREARWQGMEEFLRDELAKTTADNDRLRKLLNAANDEVHQARVERDDLRRRLRNLAQKVARSEPITLADITGSPLGDLEDTQPI